jgi:hypothetical protein
VERGSGYTILAHAAVYDEVQRGMLAMVPREAYPYRGDYDGHYAREYKEEFGRGDCKVERKWKRGGEYKEEIKCKGRRW